MMKQCRQHMQQTKQQQGMARMAGTLLMPLMLTQSQGRTALMVGQQQQLVVVVVVVASKQRCQH
jgi:hypothetical protein